MVTCTAFSGLMVPITGDVFSQDELRKSGMSETGSMLPCLMEISTMTRSDRQPISRAQAKTGLKYQPNNRALLGGAGKLNSVGFVPFSRGRRFPLVLVETT